MEKWAFLMAGVYLIYFGFTSKVFLNESEMPATEEERKAAKPTILKRTIVIGVGLASCVYSAVQFIR